MNKYIITIILLVLGANVWAQNTVDQDSTNQEVSPMGGLNALAIKYYGIEFTKEQRSSLKDKEIEFIFQVDEKGKPTLSEINGITDLGIIDSLKNKTKEIADFNPRIRNGIPEPSIYFMQLVFPTYRMTEQRLGFLQGAAYNEADFEDFEYINLDNSRIEVIFGALMNQFIGKPSNYLKVGGGMKTEVSYTGKKGYIYGLDMSIYGNKLKKDYPLNNTREQLASPSTILVGAVFGKWFNKINVQSEFHLAAQNVTEKEEGEDPEWIQLNGWSPGILVNYPIRIGKQKTMYYYGRPSVFENNLNLHFGLRYFFLSIPEASGIMAEIGVSYRMTIKGVNEYKLKDDFYGK